MTNQLKISPALPEDAYASEMTKFFITEFPQANIQNVASTVDYIASALIGTNQVRYGAMPSPESQVAIRSLVRQYIADKLPIPILMPFGSHKSHALEPIDVAEVFALKTLECLQARVLQRYVPGIRLNVRIEDTSGFHLFEANQKERQASMDYCIAFSDLVSMLGFDWFIKVIPESKLFTEDQFAHMTDLITPSIEEYIEMTDMYGLTSQRALPALQRMGELGWVGDIPFEQRDYYRSRYNVLYPGITPEESTRKLARYLGGAWARRQLNGAGDEPEWHKQYIRMTFAHPVPGAPANLYSRDIYYRTLPARFAMTHIPPWRAKGYFEISDEKLTSKLASWHEHREYGKSRVLFSNDHASVMVQSDYILT